jgi:hypothetical protein
VVPLDRLRSPAAMRAYVRGQSEEWQAMFRRLSAEAKDAGELDGHTELDGYKLIIARTDERLPSGLSA